MAYQRPLVMVFQEYAKQSVPTQTATLYPCIVGPCYHIVNAEEDEVLAFAGNYTVEGMDGVIFPNNQPGAEIQEDSISFRFKNPVVDLTDTAITVDSITDNVITFASADYPAYTEIGDEITITDTTTTPTVVGTFKIIGSNSEEFKLLINKAPNIGSGTAFEVDITRQVEDFVLGNESEFVTIDVTDESFGIVGASVSIDESEKFVSAAEVYVNYKALRQDLSDVGTVYNTDEAMGVLGKIDTHDNPLGLGVMIALANTTVGVKFIGVDSDDVAGYTAAKDRLETYEDVYSIVPLTQEASILTMFKGHAEQMSLPEVGNWRVAIGSCELPTETELQTGSGETKVDGDGDLIILQDPSAMFMSNQVDAGHELRITGSDTEEKVYTVATVISEDMLSIDPAEPFDDTVLATGSQYDYTIVNVLDKTQQAQAVRDISSSFGSQRFIHVWPSIVEIDDKQVPGYYLGCTVAGAAGGLPSHHGFTRLSVSGISRLRNSGDYFNQDQLDIIADGGTFIFLQSNPEAAPFIRHQLTTDRSTIEMAEFSFVKNFDYVSIICKDVLDNFLGKYNIVPSTLGILETAIRSVLESLKLYKLPKIGSPVLGYEVVDIHQLDDIRDRVEMYVNVDFPYPLNTVGLHLISQ